MLDFNEIPGSTPEELKTGLSFRLGQIANFAGLTLKAPLIELQFQELILGLHETTGMPVVSLIDEYDKRIIDHLGKGDSGMDKRSGESGYTEKFFGSA